jgi:hypothetical protein
MQQVSASFRRGRTISSRSVQTSGEAVPKAAGQYQPQAGPYHKQHDSTNLMARPACTINSMSGQTSDEEKL